MEADYECVPSVERTVVVKHQDVTILDICVLIWGILTYVGDISFDIYVASSNWSQFQIGFIITSVSFIIFPSVVNNLVSWLWYKEDHEKLTKMGVFLHLILLSPLMRYIQTFKLAIKAYSKKKNEDIKCFLTNYADVALLMLLEAFLEAGPQLLLQLSVIIPDHPTRRIHIRWYRYVSIVFSLISLSSAIASFHRIKRRPQSKKKDIQPIGSLFQFLWHLMFTASRIISLTCLLTVFPVFLLVGCIVHVLLFFGYLIHLNKGKRLYSYLVADYGMLFVWSLISIFVGIPIHDEPTFKFYLIYLSIFFFENLASVLPWYLKMDLWNGAVILLSVSISCFLVGLLCMIIYYIFFHPNKLDSEDEEDV